MPAGHDLIQNDRQVFIQFGKAAAEQDCQVDAFRVIVQFSPVDGKARGAGKWFWYALSVKEVFGVVIDSTLEGRGTARMPSESFDLGERFHDKTGVEMIDEVSLTVGSIKPGAVGVLSLKDKIKISFRDFRVLLV